MADNFEASDSHGVDITVWTNSEDFSAMGYIVDQLDSLIDEWFPGKGGEGGGEGGREGGREGGIGKRRKKGRERERKGGRKGGRGRGKRRKKGRERERKEEEEREGEERGGRNGERGRRKRERGREGSAEYERWGGGNEGGGYLSQGQGTRTVTCFHGYQQVSMITMMTTHLSFSVRWCGRCPPSTGGPRRDQWNPRWFYFPWSSAVHWLSPVTTSPSRTMVWPFLSHTWCRMSC